MGRPGPRGCIGLLGGSFNPAHEGHVHISREAHKRLQLDAVWWLVSPQNPLKSARGMAPLPERLARAKEAAKEAPFIHVTDIEATLGTRYTADTLKALKTRFPHARFVWIMGADNLASFHRWRRWREIARLCSILVVDRAPFSHGSLRSRAALALSPYRLREQDISLLARATPPAWAYLHLKRHPLSATQLRQGREV